MYLSSCGLMNDPTLIHRSVALVEVPFQVDATLLRSGMTIAYPYRMENFGEMTLSCDLLE